MLQIYFRTLSAKGFFLYICMTKLIWIMKRLLFVLTLLVCGGLTMSAQDIITKKDGTDIKAKVSEVGVNEIKYKDFSNLEGPVYTMPVADVLMITYENGERDVFANQASGSKSIPEGIMTLDHWTGRLSINGISIDKNSTYLYFTPDSEALYKKGDTISTIGDILLGGGIGGALGYLSGSLISSGNAGHIAVYGVCALFVAAGIPLHIVGVKKINAAIDDYNSMHGFTQQSPELSFGAQQYGIGLALRF